MRVGRVVRMAGARRHLYRVRLAEISWREHVRRVRVARSGPGSPYIEARNCVNGFDYR